MFVSAACAWEICTKVRIGKLPAAKALAESLPAFLRGHHFESLPVTLDHAQRAGLMPGAHKDPFDRMLAAQALVEDMRLATNDPVFADFGVRVIW